MKIDLKQKVVLVSGGSRGIGAAIVKLCAEAGADIAFTYIADKASAKQVDTAVRKFGQRCLVLKASVTDQKQVRNAIRKTMHEFGRIDILVNNAGIIMRKPAAEHPDEYWDKVIDINLNAQFILGREFGKDMIEQGGGKIIFTCSLLSFQGGINVPGYTASKSAVAGLVRAFGNEWGSKGVCVNGIAPGYIATNNTQALREDPERSQSILGRIPAGRWGVPDDFKGPVVFLASSASDYVNGTVLFVDGGWMAR